MTNYQDLITALTPAMYDAGAKIMAIHETKVTANIKSDGSPVTEADEAAEAILLPALRAIAPDIPIISEENAASHQLVPANGFFLVDPLDGTKEFIKQDGKGSFTVNIGLIVSGSPVMGLVYAPAFDQLFTGVVGEGATLIEAGQETRLSVRDVPTSGPVAVASASHRDDATNNWLAAHHITETTSIGSSLKFCLVAQGMADVYPRFGPTMEWDTAAGDAVLRAAGGLVTMPDGTPYPYGKDAYRNTPFIAYGGLQPD